MTEEIAEQDPFQAALHLAREEAAGGVCSMLVLDLIHKINRTIDFPEDSWRNSQEWLQNNKAVHVNIAEGTDTVVNPLTLGLPYGGRLAVSQTQFEDPSRVEQHIYYIETIADQVYGIPLWHLIEKPANSANCSMAIFLPARDQGDLDYSMVVTHQDETSPYSREQLISDEPLTHKDVLEQLKATLLSANLGATNTYRDKEAYMEKATELFDKIQLPELRKRLLPLKAGELASMRAEADPVTSYLFNMRSIAGATHKAITASSSEDDNAFKFTLDTATGKIACEGIFNLGTSKRTATLGRVLPPESPNQSYQAFLDSAPDTPSDRLFELLGNAFQIPEIVHDKTLVAQINEILIDALENKPMPIPNVNQAINKVIQEFREHNEERYSADTIIDIGELDISQLENGSFLEGACYIRANVKANKKQQVFSRAHNLYGCEVYGAKEAFNLYETFKNIRRCLAVDCAQAFVNGQFKQSVALNCTESFKTGYADFCIAEGSKKAFIDIEAQKCHTVDCEVDFTTTPGHPNRSMRENTRTHTPEFKEELAQKAKANKRRLFRKKK